MCEQHDSVKQDDRLEEEMKLYSEKKGWFPQNSTVAGPSRFIDLLTYRLPRSSLSSSTPVVTSCFCITGARTILSGYNIPDTFYEMFHLIASPGPWLFPHSTEQ